MDGELCFINVLSRLHTCLYHTDTALEIENISNCGDDLETEPHVESVATAPPDHNDVEITTIQETRAQSSQSQQTTVVPVNDGRPVSTATQSGVRSTSARSTTETLPSPSADSPRERIMSMTEPAGNYGNRPTFTPASARIQQSHTQVESTARSSGTQNSHEDPTQRQDRLIEEPPPLYCNLFSPSYVHNATNNCDSHRTLLQANYSNEQHNRLQAPRHSLCQDPSCLHHCSSCDLPLLPHSSQHHTSLLLPGEIGQHPAHNHTLRQMAVSLDLNH